MKFTKFLIDRKISIICYIMLMIFISMVIYLDGSVKVSVGNILYINLVSFSFFTIYLTASYLYYRSYYKSLCDVVGKDEIINGLPKSKSYERILFHEVLSSLYNAQSAKIQRLHEQKKEYEEFITYWVHQVKTPLAVSSLLIENNLNYPNKETLYSLKEELDKVEKYIEQALYYSKIDDFSKDYLINEVVLDRLVKEAVKKQAKTFINKKINIEIDNIDLAVTTDKKWLLFILDQVLSNALKYTSHCGRIKIYGLIEDKAQKLIIEDNGIGVKSEDLDRVFDKGFTGYNGRENYKSTGIGLYLSKRLARKLGHEISIESKYGEYTRVVIIFPKLSDYLQVSK
ncbi:MAG: sensor histidine kinase [Clostridiaceae bacterium]|nr:sensor histidine kinase [Clostridiaceae bacterium]